MIYFFTQPFSQWAKSADKYAQIINSLLIRMI